MEVLAIDWGQKRIGLALGAGGFAKPHKIVSSLEEVLEVIEEEKVEKVIVGLPEGKNRTKVQKFADRIKEETNLPMIYRSEVFTTRQALNQAIQSGKGKKARRLLDAQSAALLLQEYFDSRKDDDS